MKGERIFGVRGEELGRVVQCNEDFFIVERLRAVCDDARPPSSTASASPIDEPPLRIREDGLVTDESSEPRSEAGDALRDIDAEELASDAG
jgi:hypothetical protein